MGHLLVLPLFFFVCVHIYRWLVITISNLCHLDFLTDLWFACWELVGNYNIVGKMDWFSLEVLLVLFSSLSFSLSYSYTHTQAPLVVSLSLIHLYSFSFSLFVVCGSWPYCRLPIAWNCMCELLHLRKLCWFVSFFFCFSLSLTHIHSSQVLLAAIDNLVADWFVFSLCLFVLNDSTRHTYQILFSWQVKSESDHRNPLHTLHWFFFFLLCFFLSLVSSLLLTFLSLSLSLSLLCLLWCDV